MREDLTRSGKHKCFRSTSLRIFANIPKKIYNVMFLQNDCHRTIFMYIHPTHHETFRRRLEKIAIFLQNLLYMHL